MMYILYGIKNCDSVKKARLWLDQHEVVYRFHDFRGDGLTPELLASFIAQSSWEKLLNKRSTSWRQVDAELKKTMSAATATELMLSQCTLIKRPVLVAEDQIYIGFNAETYQTLL